MKLFSDYDRFEMEQDIIKGWDISEMIKEVVRQHLDRPGGSMSEDELCNMLLGIANINDLQCQRRFDGLEVMLKNGHFESWDIEKGFPDLKPDVEISIKKKGSKK